MEEMIFLEDIFKTYLNHSKNCFFKPDCIVDIIVPIYNGYELLIPMLASMERTNVNYHLFLINDCSPDSRISPYLHLYSRQHDNVTVIENEANKGYIKSVNQGFLRSKHHAVLLNTDIILPENWLERLIYPILCDNKVASVTPFSNAAYLCSFPVADENNPLLKQLTPSEIDQHFASIKPNYPSIPTGVGFCMALNRNVLDEIGIYNEEEYIEAYAEENDWCQHAIQAGYKNVLADNLFVYHKHHASYGQKDVSTIRTHNAQVLQMKFPYFFYDVQDYISKQQNTELINLLILLCCCNDKRAPTCLLLTSSLKSHTKLLETPRLKKLLEQDASILLLTNHVTDYILYFFNQTYHFQYAIHNLSFLSTLCKTLSVTEIELHDLYSCPSLFGILDQILGIREETSCRLTVSHHFATLLKSIYGDLPDIDYLPANEDD